MKRALLTLLTLVLASLACSVQVPNAAKVLPTATATVLPTPVPTALETPTWTATVRQVQVNVREGPNGAVISVVHSGDSVVILSCSGSWCEIEEPSGWVWRGCLSDNPMKLGCTTK